MADALTERLKKQYADREKTLFDSLKKAQPTVTSPPQPTLPSSPSGIEQFSDYNKQQFPE